MYIYCMEHYKRTELLLPNEEWLGTKIKYIEVSNFGRVRTMNPFNSSGVGMIKSQKVNKYGKVYFDVTISKKRISTFLAPLVYKTFIGDYKKGLIINHKDGNNLNCSPGNLKLGSRRLFEIKQVWDHYEIVLSNGMVVYIDVSDYLRINPTKFSIKTKKGETKPESVNVKTKNGTKSLHRLIFPNYTTIDHIDRNPLNNRKSNLRECDLSQNAMNSRGSKTVYKGVDVSADRIRATIKAYGTKYNLGSFNTPEEAAMSYDYAARILHGEFAFLNFPDINDGSFIKEKYLTRLKASG